MIKHYTLNKHMKKLIVHLILIFSTSIVTIFLYEGIKNKRATKIVSCPEAVPVSQISNDIFPSQVKGWSKTAPNNFINAAASTINSVVHIQAEEFDKGGFMINNRLETNLGSGVILDDEGYIVTNRHVIENKDYINVTLNDMSVHQAFMVGIDATTDLAVLKIHDDKPLEPIVFGNSKKAQIGEWVLAIGNPFSLNSTVTAGIISGKGRSIDVLDDPSAIESFIQTDAAVNSGNSGGALVNTEGELIGIITAILSKSGRYEGYSFAVPSDLVKKVSQDIIDYGAVQRPVLGVRIENMNIELAKSMNINETNGVLITHIDEKSAAQQAGLQSGDVIHRIDKIGVPNISILKETLAMKRPGDTTTVAFWRNGVNLELEVVLKNVNQSTTLINAPSNDSFMKLGIEIRPLNDFERELTESPGIVISGLKDEGILRELGVRQNFIIEYCNDVQIYSVNQFIHVLSSVQGETHIVGRYINKPNEELTYIF